MEEEKTCANCRRELNVGVDAIRIDEGVIGMKNFVPLDKTLFFCREDCISNYFDLGSLPNVPKRIP